MNHLTGLKANPRGARVAAMRDDELVRALSARIDEINRAIGDGYADGSPRPSRYIMTGKMIGLREAIDIIRDA